MQLPKVLFLQVLLPEVRRRGLACRLAVYGPPLVAGRRLKQAPFHLQATKQLLRLPPALDPMERELA